MKANLTGSASRRTPLLFLNVSLFLENPILSAETGEFLTLGGGQAGLAFGAIRTRPIDPLAERRLRQIEVAGDAAHALALVEHEPGQPGP